MYEDCKMQHHYCDSLDSIYVHWNESERGGIYMGAYNFGELEHYGELENFVFDN